MPGQQFSISCVASSLLQEDYYIVFVLGQRDIATTDDDDHAHLFVCQILGAL